jgi:hypothetical protein
VLFIIVDDLIDAKVVDKRHWTRSNGPAQLQL